MSSTDTHLKGLKEEILDIKWYLSIYLLFSILFIYSSKFGPKTALSGFTVFTTLSCILLLIINKKELPIHKVAFLIIIVFGLCLVFLTPIYGGPDEFEHIVRAELTSRGELIPQYIDNPGNNLTHKDYISIRSIYLINQKNEYHGALFQKTIFQTPWDTQKIDYTPTFVYCAFAQNPFYGYIAPAIGMFIAKKLDLNNIWLLWLGRLFNLILYAGIASYAIKKAPIYKEALFVCACFPLSIAQASIISIDATINSLMLLVIGYFLYMYELEDHALTWKHITIFSILTLLCALTKITFIALGLLIFLIPKSKFKNNKTNILKVIGFLAISLLTELWLKLYSNKVIANCGNRMYYLKNEASHKAYILHHPISYIKSMLHPQLHSFLLKNIFYFGNNGLINDATMGVALISFLIFCIIYPQNKKIKRSGRIGIFFIGLIILFGTITTLYLSYTKRFDLILGVQGRYLLPLLVFAPMILNINNTYKPTFKVRLLLYTLVIFFCTTLRFGTILQYLILI